MTCTPLAELPRKILGPLCWVAVFSFFLNLIFLASPLYMMQVYDRVMRSQSVPTLLSLTGIVALCYAVFAILDGVRGQVLAGVSDRVEAVLSPALMRAAMRPAAPGLARADAQHLGRDLDTVRQWIAGAGALAFVDLPWAPLYLGAIALLHWAMGLFALASVLLLAALSLAAERVARRPMARAAHAASHAHEFGEAVLRQADCASTMALADGLATAWRTRRRAMLDGQMRASRSAILLGAIARFARMLLQSAILGLGAWLAIRHEISAGAIFAGSLLLGRALAPVEAMLAGWRGTIAAHGAWQRLAPILSRPADEFAVVLPSPRGELILEEVSHTPAGAQRRAVDRISLRLGAGACLAVIGASAAGKSTLARLIAGAIRPDEGIVRLDGADLCTWQPAQLGAAIGYLPQEVALFPGTVRDNIARFAGIPDGVVVRAAQAAGAHEMILGLPDGYQTRLDAAAGALSGGQRQRVALARALLDDPALVILDEPNANLDAEGEAALIACVDALRRRRCTVLLITHRSALVRLADHVAVLAGGRLDRVEPAASFLAPRIGATAAAPAPNAAQEAHA